MKINTKVIFQWDESKNEYIEVYSEHYEHKGSVALCGGKSPKAPKPTEQEIELQKLQLEDLKEARATQKALEPYILQSLGMKRDETGAFTKMTEDERLASMSDLEKQQYRITGLELERQEKALKGELPISQATEEAYTQEREAFESEMSKRLGPQWKVSTPGIQAEKAFETRWGLLKEGERFGQMERGTGAIATQYGLLSGIQGQKTAGYATPVQYGTGLLGGYSAAMQPYQQQRMLQYDAAQKAAERKAGLLGDIGKLAGIGLYTGLSKDGWMRS